MPLQPLPSFVGQPITLRGTAWRIGLRALNPITCQHRTQVIFPEFPENRAMRESQSLHQIAAAQFASANYFDKQRYLVGYLIGCLVGDLCLANGGM